jgi:parvulin-like peptidyl-prolyl isomerase
MPWESDEEKTGPGRDWAKYMWYGVALLMALGVAALFVPWQKRNVETTRARVSHILIKIEGKDQAGRQAAVDTLKALRQQILDGANFSKLAAEYSDDTASAPKGGDLGWVQRDELTKAIDDYVWQAPLNQVSDVFTSTSGLHLVIVREREVSNADQYELQLKERVLKGQGAADAPKR